MEEKQTFIKWVKAHKKELIVAGIGVTALVALIVAVKKKDSILALWESLKKDVAEVPTKSAVESMPMAEYTSETKSAVELIPMAESVSETNIIDFPVRGHKRYLPNGNHASLEKIASAPEHGYTLQPGQTWVEGYTKGGNAV